ncbi:serine transporter family protein [Psychromonas sp. CNPT3]|uniref:serine/threonine transporter n=1 Tax=Psychromonas sp. CNPT3 TaxID=314282 RepID=UPI0002C046F7|nr:serine/threonine transporter [Psychromonas sp. CNPT3]AGH81756.1 serine transporter family protein [Psychromonas sp. CNPT3]
MNQETSTTPEFTPEITPPTIDNNEKLSVERWNKADTTWVLSLFGTAVGAGILFLPINAGLGGFWPLVVMALLVGPMIYWAHRNLARFVLSSNNPNADITDVVEEHFGMGAGKLITLLYFFAIYPILLIYGVSVTNTVESFMVHQLNMEAPARWLLSIVLIAGMMSIMITGEKLMMKITQFLVYPLVFILFGLSLFLIPEWNFSSITNIPDLGTFSSTLWLTIPVLVFAFNHSPAISTFAGKQREQYGKDAVQKSDAILKRTSAMLLGFVMFFVFSVVLSLTPEMLADAKAQNLPILSYLANIHESPIISYCGPIVAFVAIVSSFFGHYLGAREGLNGIIEKQIRSMGKTPNMKKINKFTVVFFLLTLWGVAILNPSILDMIESLGGPIIATILFLMPMYAVKRVPAMAKYQGALSNIFITFMGFVAISALVFKLA